MFWRQRGACTLPQSETFFAAKSHASHQEALDICRRCAVNAECLAYALDERIPSGIYGGTTADWRQRLLDRRPQVTSWRELLERARAEHHRAHAPCLPLAAPVTGRPARRQVPSKVRSGSTPPDP
ncbi:WhiB family transcriptional regulator [Streptomyces sp. ET3-23]|uniref:WhiB family transcriptional regulator n=1 Tax=Streptomyces sp. ET3-23 TaxID=2885643 RepID=UPI001D12892F|nr:WhiB family transcriptional regulator [Streptomyces sp. ET3-23]MCC2280935.1 WhiB family transcriptional regulator [Streptomyces sp. ET3-23]